MVLTVVVSKYVDVVLVSDEVTRVVESEVGTRTVAEDGVDP